jgi:hypothetical protein
MAKDGISIQFRGGDKLDRALSKMAVTHQSKSSAIVNSSLSAATTQVKKELKREVPVWGGKDTKGFKTKSRNTSVGQLRRSIVGGLRKQVDVPRDVFLAGVWFKTAFGGAKTGYDDGFFIKFLDEKTKSNAFGATGGHNFIAKGVKKSESKFKNKIGGNLARKISILSQKIINKEL